MRTRKAIVNSRTLLATMTLLAIALFSLFPFVEVKATDNNYWNLDFNSNIPSYSMPNGYSTDIIKAHWNTQGHYRFNNSDCRMEGIFKPPDNIINYTFSIRFYHTKYQYYNPATLADSQQLLFRLGTYTLLGTHDKEFLTIMVGDADTDSPYLQMRIETYTGSGGSLTSYSTIQLAGGFSNDVWHTLVMTYCFPNQKIYAYFDNNYWTSESLSRTGSYIWPSNNVLNLDIGAWKNIGYYFNWFSGYIDYVSWESVYTTSYQSTRNYLWYHFDEYSGSMITDSSGNAYHGTLDTVYMQRVDHSGYMENFGYYVGGKELTASSYGITISSSLPIISDKFTSSFYVKFEVGTASTTSYTVCLKTFRFDTVYTSATGKWNFILNCKIGGTARTLTTSTYLNAGINNVWLYVYCKYDGSELRLSIQNANNRTVFYNSSGSYTGTITETSGAYSSPGLIPNVVTTSFSTCIDELKLTKNILGPWSMNGTTFGPPENVTVITPISEDYWLEGNLSPDTYYLTPTNPTGTGILMINSSGQFTLRMRDGYQYLYNIFDIYGFNATAWSLPAAVYYKTISFTMKDNTPSGTYFGQVNVTNSYGIPQSQFFGFTLVVSRTGEFENRTTPFDVLVINSPLNLLWDDTKSGQILIIISGKNNQTTPLCGYTSERFDMSIPKWDSYKTIFDENDYVEDLRDNLGHQYFRITYSIDNRILNYGNLTIYHYVRIYQRDNPEIFTTRELVININIEAILYPSDKLWITLSTSSITGKSGEIKQVTLNVFSNKRKYVYWTPSQPYDSIRPEYVFVTGDNYLYTNYSVILSVRIPQSCDVPRIVTMRVFEVYNPLLNNQTILTVNGIPTGADFSFSIIPLEGYLDSLNQKSIFRATITNNYGEIDSYFLNAKWNVTALTILVGGTSSKPWYVGKDWELVFDIHVIASGTIKNGLYQIQFTAYTYNASNYVSKSVMIYVTGDITGGTGGTGGGIDGRDGTGNMTSLTGIISIPTVTLNPNVGLMPMIVALSSMWGMAYEGVAFGIGLLLCFIAFIILGKYAKSHLLQIIGSVGMMVFVVMLGLWPMFALILIGMIGAALMSWKVFGK